MVCGRILLIAVVLSGMFMDIRITKERLSCRCSIVAVIDRDLLG